MRLYLIVLAEDLLAALLIPSEALNGCAAHVPRSHILEKGVKCAEQALPHGNSVIELSRKLHCMVEHITNRLFALMPRVREMVLPHL